MNRAGEMQSNATVLEGPQKQKRRQFETRGIKKEQRAAEMRAGEPRWGGQEEE